jgi:hypothetical protein
MAGAFLAKFCWRCAPISILAVVLAGCIGGSGLPAEPPHTTFLLPVHCYSTKQCDAMWAAAQGELEEESGMKIRMVTDTRMETYNETSYGRMYGEVKKWRSPDNSDSTITADFSCERFPGCRPDTAERHFMTVIRTAGQGY